MDGESKNRVSSESAGLALSESAILWLLFLIPAIHGAHPSGRLRRLRALVHEQRFCKKSNSPEAFFDSEWSSPAVHVNQTRKHSNAVAEAGNRTGALRRLFVMLATWLMRLPAPRSP
jgi:hypothetical protein